MKKKIQPSSVLSDIKAARDSLNLNQAYFWALYGITQSGGSRLEKRKRIATPLAILMVLHEQGRIGEEDLGRAKALASFGVHACPTVTKQQIKAFKTWQAKQLEDRKASGYSQSAYWQKFGAGQSGGSRYEIGGNIPFQILMLMALLFENAVSEEVLLEARSIALITKVKSTVEPK